MRNYALVAGLFLGLATAQAEPLDGILGIHVGDKLADVHKRIALLGRHSATKDKEVWTLESGDYSTVVFQLDDDREVEWVTAFVRPGRNVAFSTLGDLKSAKANDNQAIWSFPTKEGGYRLSAKGTQQMANVVTLMKLPVSLADVKKD